MDDSYHQPVTIRQHHHEAMLAFQAESRPL